MFEEKDTKLKDIKKYLKTQNIFLCPRMDFYRHQEEDWAR